MRIEHANWQEQYSVSESRWQDLRRIFLFIFPIFFVATLATLYAVLYAAIQYDGWFTGITSEFSFYLSLFKMYAVIFLPAVIVFAWLLFILKQGRDLVSAVYQPPADEKITPLILRKLLGIPPFPPPLNTLLKYPFVVIREAELAENHWTRWFGGPATLVIYDGVALYLERGNKFSRVVGPGAPMPLLERYEKIKEVVDLRPQTREGTIEPWTKDGIRIKLTIRAEVQIDANTAATLNSSKFRYPFDADAVKSAVEFTAVRLSDSKLQEVAWLEGVWGNITGAIIAFVAGHSLDELFLSPQMENHANSIHQNNDPAEDMEQILSREISDKVTGEIRSKMQKNGVRVLNLQITQIEVPHRVRELRIKYWESIRQKIAAQRNSRAEAERIRARELTHAESQRTMLMTIMKRLENVDPKDLTEPLILSLSGILDQGLDDPIIRPLVAKESLAVLERIRKLLGERF
jgi:hypothetical protein